MSGRFDEERKEMGTNEGNSYGAKATLQFSGGSVTYFRLASLSDAGLVDLDKLPFSIRILLHISGAIIFLNDVQTFYISP